MAFQQTYEGTPAQLVEQLRLLPGTQQYRMTLTSEESAEDVENLEATIARMTSRTPEEIVATRERLLAATPPPRALPDDKSIFDVVMGTWAGNETDEQIRNALEKLS